MLPMLAVTRHLSIGTPFIINRKALNLPGQIQLKTTLGIFPVAQVLITGELWPQILFVCCKRMELYWIHATMPSFGM